MKCGDNDFGGGLSQGRVEALGVFADNCTGRPEYTVYYPRSKCIYYRCRECLEGIPRRTDDFLTIKVAPQGAIRSLLEGDPDLTFEEVHINANKEAEIEQWKVPFDTYTQGQPIRR
jgi:hypothetical protein